MTTTCIKRSRIGSLLVMNVESVVSANRLLVSSLVLPAGSCVGQRRATDKCRTLPVHLCDKFCFCG